MRVLIRADACAVIGSGHFVRCRSLGRALRGLGAEVRFIGRVPAGRFRQEFEREFPLILLPLLTQPIDPASGRWLPVPELEDALFTRIALEAEGSWRPDWIVVDHYGLSAIWHQQLRLFCSSVRIAVIDDLADRAHDADLLIDHNTIAGDPVARYRPWLPVDRDVSFCLGPQFALIDPFYAGFQGALPPRQRLQRLLISLGGAGDLQLLEQILQVLVSMPRQGWQIQLVMGSFASESPKIQSLCDQLEVQRISSVPSLAPLMASADAAIGAGGTTTWERLCLGLPCITYALADNQVAYSQVLAARGLIEYLGRPEAFDAGELQRVLLRWLQDSDLLQRQSAQAMALVDGQGCVRIARLMSSTFDPRRWSELVQVNTDSQTTWCWPDGLRLAGGLNTQTGPLRCLDLLQINRYQPLPPAGFQRSSCMRGSSVSVVRRVTVLSSRGSWMNRYIPVLLERAMSLGCSLRWVHDHRQLRQGDVCFLLSYGRIVAEDWLAMHQFNLVVHASDLPQGKGWSPMTWQILDGAAIIPLTLFEAAIDLDSGPIHARELLHLKGNELAPEWQELQAEATIRLCIDWLRDYPASASRAVPQSGEQSCFSRRRPEDSRLDPASTLQEQFPLLQVVDNEDYPAFFEWNGRFFRLRIEPWD